MSIIDPSLTGAHISDNLAAYESARSGFFTFYVTGAGVPDATGRTFTDKLYDKLSNALKSKITKQNMLSNLSLNVLKSSVPQFSLTALEFRRGNDTIKFAGTPTFDAGSLTIDDIVGLDTKSILQAWKELAYDPVTRKGGRMKDYKVDCTLCEYTQDYQLIRSWTLYGCWISQITDSEFDRTSDAKRQLGAQVQYDRSKMENPT